MLLILPKVWRNHKIKFLVLKIIRFYQKYISPLKKPCCRFRPNCSDYALEAFSKHGFFKAFFLSLKRFLKCNPIFKGGYDPVPENEFNKKDI